MKKSPRKLTITAETVRILSSTSLNLVTGGDLTDRSRDAPCTGNACPTSLPVPCVSGDQIRKCE